MNTPLEHKKAAFHTLGCKLNFAETSSLQDALRQRGMIMAKKGEVADLCIINTCSVTDVADSKCRQTIHKFTRQHPGAFVVVTGCYAQLSAEKLAQEPGVGVVLGIDKKGQVLDYVVKNLETNACGEWYVQPTKDVRNFVHSCSRGDRTRYFLKVQDGCDYFCTYCTIPFARGFSRNPTIESLVNQVKEAAKEGAKEIVLTGVNIGDF